MEFQEKIKDIRKQSGLSQEQFAQKLNVTRQAVSNWERGVSHS
ncbi:MAG: helix-turn-helix transcriptional regulator [Bulleidia sp.]